MDIIKLIENEARSRGIEKYKIQTTFIDITAADLIFDLNKYIYLFCSEDIDCKIHTKVELISGDNYLAITKNVLKGMNNSKYQFFTGELEIKTSNYGKLGSFIPYRLEFYKIIPENK